MNDKAFSNREYKIYSTLCGASIGDALASSTDGKSRSEIMKIYGGLVQNFIKPNNDTAARGRALGQVTDAFSIPFYLLKEIVESKGVINNDVAVNALIKWGKSEYFEQFAGMTTRKVINLLNMRDNTDFWSTSGHLGNKLFKGHFYALSSNGAACKAIATGMINNEQIEDVILNTKTITMTSHDDRLSISGACAVATAIAEAFQEKSTVFSVVQKSLYGAQKGYQLASDDDMVNDYPGPSIYKRIKIAQQIALKNYNSDVAVDELRDIIGCGPGIAETVPTEIGLVIARQNNTIQAIFDAVNVGDETCAISTIVGAIIGAMYGATIFSEEWIDIVEKQNDFRLERLSKSLSNI